jgi:uncharacterized protein YxeA
MELLVLVMIFAGIFAIYDAIRKVNNNILKQTDEIKKIREVLTRSNKE